MSADRRNERADEGVRPSAPCLHPGPRLALTLSSWPRPSPTPVQHLAQTPHSTPVAFVTWSSRPAHRIQSPRSMAPKDPVTGHRLPCRPHLLPSSSFPPHHTAHDVKSYPFFKFATPVHSLCLTAAALCLGVLLHLPGVASSRKPTSCSALRWCLCSPNLSTGHPLSSHLCSPLVSEHLEDHLL